MGRNEEAIADYTNALRLAPDFTECRYCRGLALKRMGRFDEALEDYSQVLEEDPCHVSAYNNRGVILMSRGRMKEALRDFNAASEIDPNDPTPRYNQGAVMGAMARYEEAIAAFTFALELNPQHELAYVMRAKAYTYEGKLDSTEADLLAARGLGADSAEFHAIRARLFLARSMYEQCHEEICRAAEINPESRELRSLLMEIETSNEDLDQTAGLEDKGDDALSYRQEEGYRELLRPRRELDPSLDMFREFLLAETFKDIARVAQRHPLILDEELLDILESIGESRPPIRMLVRRNVAALRNILTQLENMEE